MTLVPISLLMPSARSRAVMSADEPAGNSTVISIVGLCANGFGGAFSAAATVTSVNSPSSGNRNRVTARSMAHLCSVVAQDLLDLHAAVVARGQDTGADHCQRAGGKLATHFRHSATATGGGEFLELFHECVVITCRDCDGLGLTALQNTQAVMKIIKCGSVFSINIHQIVLRRRRVARIHRRERT